MVYNEDKTKELKEYDLEKGYLKDDELIIHHDEIKGQKEKWHYKIVKEYDNGGKDIEKIIDEPEIEQVDAYDEHILIKIYVPYTKSELNIIEKNKKIEKKVSEMNEYKKLLSMSDYEAIKYAEGWFTKEEYQPIKEKRESFREKIRKIEEEIENLSKM